MVQVAVFALVLVAVFALKAASIMLTRDSLASGSAVFSMVQPTAQDAVVPASETMGAQEAESARQVGVPARVYRRARVA